LIFRLIFVFKVLLRKTATNRTFYYSWFRDVVHPHSDWTRRIWFCEMSCCRTFIFIMSWAALP